MEYYVEQEGIILSKSLLDENLLKEVKFDDKKIKSIKDEVEALCAHCRRSFSGK